MMGIPQPSAQQPFMPQNFWDTVSMNNPYGVVSANGPANFTAWGPNGIGWMGPQATTAIPGMMMNGQWGSIPGALSQCLPPGM